MMEHSSESPGKAALSDSSVSLEKPIIESEEKEHDYYAILEIPSTANTENIGGSYNRIFNRLTALQHSHDGPQAPETLKKFKDLEEAYQILSNPVKRKVYDNRNRVQQQPESIINQTYKAIVSRLRSPSFSVGGGGIAGDVIENVVSICQGGIEGLDSPLDPRVVDIIWGTPIDGRVDRQAACYYRISISSEKLAEGFLINCKSAHKDKFKLVMFDSSGKLLHLEDSMRSKDKQSTEATLLFTLFNKGNQIQSDSVDEKILSSPFFLSEKLESIVSYERVVPPGKFLICVYGDNMIGKSNFNLVAVPANNDANEVTIIKAADTSLITLKKDLKGLEAEYVKTKSAFEIAAHNMRREEQRAEKLLEARDRAYKGFIDSSLALFTFSRPVQSPVVAEQSSSSNIDTRDSRHFSNEQDADVEGGAKERNIAAVAGSTAVMAATSASNAGGWLVKKMSEGMTQLQRRRGSAVSPPPQSATLSNRDEEVAAPVEISQSSNCDQESAIPIENNNETDLSKDEGITNNGKQSQKDNKSETDANIDVNIIDDVSIIDNDKNETPAGLPLTASEE